MTTPSSTDPGGNRLKKKMETPPTATNTPSPAGSTSSLGHSAARSVVCVAFGPDADLYADVLQVSSFATDRDIRTAYFRRGRQVLSEPDHVAGADGEEIVNSTRSTRAKLQFQAVSTAYEVLSDPKLRREYDRTGIVPTDLASKLSSDPPVSQLRGSETEIQSVKTKPSSPSRTRSKQGVHWNEHVEELVIQNDVSTTDSTRNSDAHDEEDDESLSSESTASSLHEHLKRLDQNTENFAKQEFLDSLEDSMNGLISAASRAREKGMKKEHGEEVLAETKSNDVERNGSNSKNAVRRRLFFNMKDMKKKSDKSGVSVERSPLGGVLTKKEAKSDITPPRSDNDTASTVTEQGGEVVTLSQPIRLSRKGDNGVSTGDVHIDVGEDCISNKDVPDDERSADTENLPSRDGEKAEKAEDRVAPPAEDPNLTNKSESDDTAANFYIHLLAYIKSVVEQIKDGMDKMGSSCNEIECRNVPNSCAEPFVIREEEFDSLVRILQREVDQAPAGWPIGTVFSFRGKEATGSAVAAAT